MTRIYVGNLPYTADEESVRALFSQHGTVDAVRLINDRETGRFRGFCFVEMPESDAQTAIARLPPYAALVVFVLTMIGLLTATPTGTERDPDAIGALLVVTLGVVLAACRQDMHNGPRYRPLQSTTFFANGSSSRMVVPNTVARGQLNEDRHLYEGVVDGRPAETFPMPVTADVMARGVPSGPKVGEALRALEAWWIEQDFAPDRDALLARL